MARLKVVAHKKSGQLVKGYADLSVPIDRHGNPESSAIALPKSIHLEPADLGRALNVATDTLKALFFVKSFEGDASNQIRQLVSVMREVLGPKGEQGQTTAAETITTA